MTHTSIENQLLFPMSRHCLPLFCCLLSHISVHTSLFFFFSVHSALSLCNACCMSLFHHSLCLSLIPPAVLHFCPVPFLWHAVLTVAFELSLRRLLWFCWTLMKKAWCRRASPWRPCVWTPPPNPKIRTHLERSGCHCWSLLLASGRTAAPSSSPSPWMTWARRWMACAAACASSTALAQRVNWAQRQNQKLSMANLPTCPLHQYPHSLWPSPVPAPTVAALGQNVVCKPLSLRKAPTSCASCSLFLAHPQHAVCRPGRCPATSPNLLVLFWRSVVRRWVMTRCLRMTHPTGGRRSPRSGVPHSAHWRRTATWTAAPRRCQKRQGRSRRTLCLGTVAGWWGSLSPSWPLRYPCALAP